MANAIHNKTNILRILLQIICAVNGLNALAQIKKCMVGNMILLTPYCIVILRIILEGRRNCDI